MDCELARRLGSISQMDIKQLRALVTVADTGNVTKASTRLNLVQPAVSRQLRLLEEDVGVRLFERSAHGMILTTAGHTLVSHARRVLEELELARAALCPATTKGIVHLGLLPTTCEALSSNVMAAVAQSDLDTELRITMGFVDHLHAGLASGSIDAALIYDLKVSSSLTFYRLLTEDLWVAGDLDSGLSPNRPVRLVELQGRPLILPKRPRRQRTMIDDAARAAGVELHVVAETDAVSVQRSMAQGGIGLTILPAVAIALDARRGLLAVAPLIEPRLHRELQLALSNTRRIAPTTRGVVRALTRCMQSLVADGYWPSATWLAKELP